MENSLNSVRVVLGQICVIITKIYIFLMLLGLCLLTIPADVLGTIGWWLEKGEGKQAFSSLLLEVLRDFETLFCKETKEHSGKNDDAENNVNETGEGQ